MRCAVDAHAIGRQLTGNEVYVRSLLNGFSSLDKESEFITYISGESAKGWVPARFTTRDISANPFVRLGVELSVKLRADRPDLVHVQYTAPLRCPVPVVVSVHDVSFLEHPEFFPKLRALQLRATVRRTVRSAARVLAPTEFSRSSILRAYPMLDPAHVIMVPNAAAGGLHPVSHERAARMVRDRFGIAGPFLLSVGDLQPRKNQIGLINAFARLVRSHPRLTHKLVLVGKDTWFAPRVREAARRSGAVDRICFPGFVEDADLLHFYNACEFFVFPSFYEGFGLPVLEAMACGKAVACSNTSALPEVADGAGILFDPYSVDEITRALVDLIVDPELRARMERLGVKRAGHFSWRASAQQTLAIYHEVAEQNRPAGKRLRPAPMLRG
jgi:glycosyltransferase involved in cell wall biosynthesis